MKLAKSFYIVIFDPNSKWGYKPFSTRKIAEKFTAKNGGEIFYGTNSSGFSQVTHNGIDIKNEIYSSLNIIKQI